jgi:uncharacterized membrane-anchored protein
MNPKVLFGLFVAVAMVQLAAPLGQIWKHEDILRTGVAYKFRTAPVDPYDAFRGRYVALNYADAVTTSQEALSYRSPAYVALTTDAQGFAKFGLLTLEPPAAGDYLRVEYLWGNLTNAHFRLPFDKFFMEETKAPQAEQAYWRHGNRRGEPTNSTYALVRVKGGRGVIEDLYIKDQPIREFLALEAAKTQP